MTEPELATWGKGGVVIGLVPATTDPNAISGAIRSIAESSLPSRAVLIHPPCAGAGEDPGDPGTAGWQFLPEPLLTQNRLALAESLGQSFRKIYALAGSLEASACVIISSGLSTVTGEWVKRLVDPVINNGFDLVAPRYAHAPFDGVINRSIVYPMVRTLYGKRIRNPLGPDFGMSGRLVARMAVGVRPRLHPLVSLVAEAIAAEMKVCETWLGVRVYPPQDWSNPGPFLSQILAALFLDVERFAPWWQRARGSHPITEFGSPDSPGASPPPVDPALMLQGFQAGVRGSIDDWGTVLPPSTLVELRRLAQLKASHFRILDETWAHIVYDFALAHRLRPNGRDQILRSFAPLYMGWVASYAMEIANASSEAVEQRIEELCCAFEAAKPYLVSRWRWPDRFNP